MCIDEAWCRFHSSILQFSGSMKKNNDNEKFYTFPQSNEVHVMCAYTSDRLFTLPLHVQLKRIKTKH